MGGVDLAVRGEVVAPELADTGLTASGEGIKASICLEGILALLVLAVQDNVGVINDGGVEGRGGGKLVLRELDGGDTDSEANLAGVQHAAVSQTVGSEALTRLGRNRGSGGENVEGRAREPSRGGLHLDEAAASRAGEVSGDGDRGRNRANTGRSKGAQDSSSAECVLVTSGDGNGDITSSVTSNNLPVDSIGSTGNQRVSRRARGLTATARAEEKMYRLDRRISNRVNPKLCRKLINEMHMASRTAVAQKEERPQRAQQKSFAILNRMGGSGRRSICKTKVLFVLRKCTSSPNSNIEHKIGQAAETNGIGDQVTTPGPSTRNNLSSENHGLSENHKCVPSLAGLGVEGRRVTQNGVTHSGCDQGAENKRSKSLLHCA